MTQSLDRQSDYAEHGSALVDRVARIASGETTWRWENGVSPYDKTYWRRVARDVLDELARKRCKACQIVTDAGKPTTCPNCPCRLEGQEERRKRIHDACRGGVLGPVM